MQCKKVILGSGSPRRRELLHLLFERFEVVAADVDETLAESEPQAVAEKLAMRKAEAVLQKTGEADALIIGADTLVFAEGQILGKPRDKADAKAMLRLLSGRTHQVITGVALLEGGRGCVFSETTDVTFAPMKPEEIEEYVATADPMDKAGAYGIQGRASRYIAGIRGCYYNVMGLPVHRLYEELKSMEFPGWR